MEDNVITFDLTGSGESEAFANLILGLNKNGVPYKLDKQNFDGVITITITSILGSNMEDGNPISFKQVLKYYPILPQLIDPFSPTEHMTKRLSHRNYYGSPIKIEKKTLSLISSHPLWNGYFLDATKKLMKIK